MIKDEHQTGWKRPSDWRLVESGAVEGIKPGARLPPETWLLSKRRGTGAMLNSWKLFYFIKYVTFDEAVGLNSGGWAPASDHRTESQAGLSGTFVASLQPGLRLVIRHPACPHSRLWCCSRWPSSNIPRHGVLQAASGQSGPCSWAATNSRPCEIDCPVVHTL